MANTKTNTDELVERQIRRNIVTTGTIVLDAMHISYKEAITQYDRFNDEEARERSLGYLRKMQTEIDRIEKILIQN